MRKPHILLIFILPLFFLMYTSHSQSNNANKEISVSSQQDQNDMLEKTEVEKAIIWGLTKSKFWGVLSVLMTLIALIAIILINLKLGTKKLVTIYRPYEETLLNLKRLKLEDMLEYHSQYNWGNYAAITIGMVLLSITMLVIEFDKIDDSNKTLLYFALGFMSVSAVLLYYADLLHINTQTPIIPIKSRFRLIDWSVRFGSFGAMLMILSVFFFISMISLGATIFACITYVAISFFVTMTRRVPLKEFKDYFGIDSDKEIQDFEEMFTRINSNKDTTVIPYVHVNDKPIN